MRFLLVVLPLAVAACAPARTPAPDAGDAALDADADAGDDDDGSGDAGVAADAGVVVPDGAVAWSEELPNPYEFPGPDDADGVLDPIAVDFYLQYTVDVPEKNEPPARLTTRICTRKASWTEASCGETFGDAVEGGGGYRWGFDPSQYESGRNTYTHTLSLEQDGVLIDEETLTFVVTAP